MITFTPENSLHRRSIPFQPPCLPPDLASHQILPATYPACHPTLSAMRPCQPPVPAPHPSLTAYPACLPASHLQARLCCECCKAQVQSQSSYKGCMCHGGVPVKVQPPLITCTPHLMSFLPPPQYSTYPSNILCTLSYIPCTSTKVLFTPPNILSH